MVQQPRRRKRQRKFLGSHQRAWIWGRYPVLETLKAGIWKPLELRVSARLSDVERAEAESLAESVDVEPDFVSPEELTTHCGTTEHQGYAARMPTFPYAEWDEIPKDVSAAPIFVVLDAIQDPHNFGAILRSADAMGIDAVIVGKTGQSEITSQVVRSSAGAVNHVPIASIENLLEFIELRRAAGLQVVGASEKDGTSADQCDFTRPSVLIIGNEGSGIRPELLQLCDATATIPQVGAVGSLNAAVSAGILFYEARRQRSAANR